MVRADHGILVVSETIYVWHVHIEEADTFHDGLQHATAPDTQHGPLLLLLPKGFGRHYVYIPLETVAVPAAAARSWAPQADCTLTGIVALCLVPLLLNIGCVFAFSLCVSYLLVLHMSHMVSTPLLKFTDNLQ